MNANNLKLIFIFSLSNFFFSMTHPLVKIKILRKKEIETEECLMDFLNKFETQYESTSTAGTSADLRQENKLKSLKRSLTGESMLTAKKYLATLKSVVIQREEDHLENLFGHIKATSLTDTEMNYKYAECFKAFLSSPDVSFETQNTDLLGNVDIRDQFVLTMWSMITVRRETGDNLLQLICSGASSTGKQI